MTISLSMDFILWKYLDLNTTKVTFIKLKQQHRHIWLFNVYWTLEMSLSFKSEEHSLPYWTDNNNNNVYFKSLSYTNVLFKLEMNAQQNKIFW
jgi:hypothetical protein